MALIDYIPFQCLRIFLDSIQLYPVDPEMNLIVMFINVNKEILKLFCRKNLKDSPTYPLEITITWVDVKKVRFIERDCNEENRVLIDFMSRAEFTICEIFANDEVFGKLESTMALILQKRSNRTEQETLASIRVLSTVEDSDFGTEEDSPMSASVSSSAIIPSSFQTIEDSQEIFAAASVDIAKTLERAPYVVEDTPPTTQEDDAELNVIPCTPAELKNPPDNPNLDGRCLHVYEGNVVSSQDEEEELLDSVETESERAASPLSEGDFGGVVVPDTDYEDTQSNCSDSELDNYVEKTLSNLKNIADASQEIDVQEMEVQEMEAQEMEVQEMEAPEMEVQEMEAPEMEVQEMETSEMEVQEMEEDPTTPGITDTSSCSVTEAIEMISNSQIVLLNEKTTEINAEEIQKSQAGPKRRRRMSFVEMNIQTSSETENQSIQQTVQRKEAFEVRKNENGRTSNIIEYIDDLSKSISNSAGKGSNTSKKTSQKKLNATPSEVIIDRNQSFSQKSEDIPLILLKEIEKKKTLEANLKISMPKTKAALKAYTIPRKILPKPPGGIPVQLKKNEDIPKKKKRQNEPEMAGIRKISKTSDGTSVKPKKSEDIPIKKKLKLAEMNHQKENVLPENGAVLGGNETSSRKISHSMEGTPIKPKKREDIQVEKKLKVLQKHHQNEVGNKTPTRKISQSLEGTPVRPKKIEDIQVEKKLKVLQKHHQNEAGNKTPTRKISQSLEGTPIKPKKPEDIQVEKKMNVLQKHHQNEAGNKTPTRKISQSLEGTPVRPKKIEDIQVEKKLKVLQKHHQNEVENKTPTRKISQSLEGTPIKPKKPEEIQVEKKLKVLQKHHQNEEGNKTPTRKISQSLVGTPVKPKKTEDIQVEKKMKVLQKHHQNEAGNKTPTRKISQSFEGTPVRPKKIEDIQVEKKLKVLQKHHQNEVENKTPTRKMSQSLEGTPIKPKKPEEIQVEKKLKVLQKHHQNEEGNKTPTRKISQSLVGTPVKPKKTEDIQVEKMKVLQKHHQNEAGNKTPTRKISQSLEGPPVKKLKVAQKNHVLPDNVAELERTRKISQSLEGTPVQPKKREEMQIKKAVQKQYQNEAEVKGNRTPTRKISKTSEGTPIQIKKNEEIRRKELKLPQTEVEVKVNKTPTRKVSKTLELKKNKEMKKPSNNVETKGRKQQIEESKITTPISEVEINNNNMEEPPRRILRKPKLPTTPSRTSKKLLETPKESKKRYAESDSDEWTPQGIIKIKKKMRRSVAIVDDEPHKESFFSSYSRGATLTKTHTRLVTRTSRFCDELNTNSEAESRRTKAFLSSESEDTDDDFIKTVITRQSSTNLPPVFAETQNSNDPYKPKESVIVRNHSQSTSSTPSGTPSTPKTPRRRLSHTSKSALNEEPEAKKCTLPFAFVENEEEFLKSFKENLSQTTLGYQSEAEEAPQIETDSEEDSEIEDNEIKLSNGESSSNEKIPATDPAKRPYKPFPVFTSESSNYNSPEEPKLKITTSKKCPTKHQMKKTKFLETKIAYRQKMEQTSKLPKRPPLQNIQNKLPPVILPDFTPPDLETSKINELKVQPYLFQDIPESQENDIDNDRLEIRAKELVDRVIAAYSKKISEKQFFLLAVEVFNMCLKCFHNFKGLNHLLLINFNKVYCDVLKLAINKQ